MDKDIYFKSLEKHLDSLETTLNWSLVLVLAAFWYGLQNAERYPTLNFLILQTPRENAYLVLG